MATSVVNTTRHLSTVHMATSAVNTTRHLSTVHISTSLLNPTRRLFKVHTPTSLVNTTRHSSRIRTTPCLPFTVSDNRPFYEREYPQMNLPRRLSNSSYQNVLHQLPSLRLIVVACARNVESNIKNYRSRIEPILDLFHPSSRILICESDSNDKTIEKLYQWSRAQVYTYGNMMKSYPGRTDRLEFCRNTLLNKTHDLKADYILVTDIDMFRTTVPSFLSNFRYNIDDWSVMTASSSDPYYDIWALRTLSDSIMNYDIWHRIWDLRKPGKNYCYETLVDLIVRVHQKRIPLEYGLIEVRSAFGGAGLYKANSTYTCQYDGENNTCEHIEFHLCIREQNHGRIFINSAFQVF
ncbi:unnamed protein product [Adineta steineri]|uniref:Uncharacterized protein n=1 Tax=Adineta steineri TaxID=433720 RepID=A0A815NSZ8_9BILA|nr:unnamed protein product [Adineta steineri]CAF4033927.1 unnamed protein product [Adineta steineri]